MESLTGVFDKGVNTRKILIATLTATIGGFLFGYDIGVVGPALVYLTPFFHLTTIETAFVGSGIFLTAFFAAIINGKLADEYGRKKLLIMDGVIFLIFAIFTALSVNATMVIIGRLAIGEFHNNCHYDSDIDYKFRIKGRSVYFLFIKVPYQSCS